MTARNVQTAIVLQGGGALGAYEYGVLKALYDSRPGFRPVAVAGISIDPSFRDTVAVSVADDRYLVVSFADEGPPPDTVTSVPARR